MDRLLLVDGSNLLFQMFYGMPARIPGRDGRPVHGTLGFTGALLRVLRMRVPTHCAVFFDGEHENPRKALDEAYKANRPDFSHMEEQETPLWTAAGYKPGAGVSGHSTDGDHRL